MSGYSVFARYYDELTANIDYKKRGEYFHEIIKKFKQTKENIPSKPKSIKDILKKAVQKVVYIIRRLIPVECERLQGYPDDWTRYGADGNEIADTARYKAIGNSICVFCAERVYLGILDVLGILTEVADERENQSIL